MVGDQTDGNVADLIGQLLYSPLLDEIKRIVEPTATSLWKLGLKERALTIWTKTASAISQGQPSLTAHINTIILPQIADVAAATDAIFLMFFSWNKNTEKIWFWCPKEERVRRSLGFPYDVTEIVTGIGQQIGLNEWMFPLRHNVEGLASLERVYKADLTDLQLNSPHKLTHPDGDFLIGLKSVIYLPLRKGDTVPDIGASVCICSFIPSLFGPQVDYRDLPFSTALELLVDNQLLRSKLAVRPVLELLLSKVRADEDQIKTWVYQTAGLAHKFRREARTTLEYCATLRSIESRMKDADPSLRPIAAELRSARQYLEVTTTERSEFFEFLHEYAQAQRRGIAPDPSTLTPFCLDDDSTAKALRYMFRRVKKELAEKAGRNRFPRLSLRLMGWKKSRIFGLGVLSFIWHEFLANGLAHGRHSGTLIFSCEMHSGSMSELCFSVTTNLNVVKYRDNSKCRSCRAPNTYHDSRLGGPYCLDCLRIETASWLSSVWTPGKLSGTGLGLFLIQEFARRLYKATFIASTGRWNTKNQEVTLGFRIPKIGNTINWELVE